MQWALLLVRIGVRPQTKQMQLVTAEHRTAYGTRSDGVYSGVYAMPLYDI